MNRVRRSIKPIAVFVLTSALFVGGALEFAERALTDLRFATLQRDATGSLVLVSIDPKSLDEVGVWPWPRSFHARLLVALDAIGVGRVAYDIDFSTRSTPSQDAALELALENHPDAVILPTFRQFANPSSDEVVEALPLARFARHAILASINVRPDSDGRIRQVQPVQDFGDLLFPFMGVRLAKQEVAAQPPFYVDFGIRAGTIPVVSFVDVLLGRVDPEVLRDRNVIVGSTAVELGDQLATPVYRSLPGAVVQALAYESVIQGRTLTRTPVWLTVLTILLLSFAATAVFNRLSVRGATIAFAGLVSGVIALSLAVQGLLPILVDVTPWLLVATLVYALTLLATIGRQAETINARTLEAGLWRRRLSAVFEASFDAIVSVGKTGEIRGLSRSAKEQFGSEPPDASRTIKELMPLPPGALPGGASNEALGRRADGSFFSADVSVTHVDDDERLAVVRDTTDRKVLEKEAEQYLNISQDLVAVLDQSGRIVRLNPTWQKVLGYAPDTLVGNNLGVLITGADGQMLREMLEDGPTREGTLSFEARLDTRSGQPKWFSWIIIRHDDGEKIFVSGRDISERRRLDAMKDQFVTSISQNLLLPLNAVRGMISALGSGDGKAVDRTRLLELASHNTEQMIRLVNEVVQLQRLEAGEIEMGSETIDIASLCRRVIEDTSPTARHGSVTVTLADHTRSVRVLGDREQLTQMAVILVTNAIDAAPPGTNVSLTLEADGPSLRIAVRDEGPGIPQAARHTLFEPLATTGANRSGSLGLGLAKGLVERHGGTVSFQTEEGKGTTFFVTLPIHRENVVAFEPRDGTRAS